MKPTDVGRPPGDAAKTDVQPGLHLRLQFFKGGGDIARPDGGAISLAAGPGRAAKGDDFVLAFSSHPFVECMGMQLRVDIGHCQAIAQMIAEVFRIGGIHFRFAGIQPEHFDAVLIVAFSDTLPKKCPGFGVGGVNEMDGCR